MLIDWVLCRYAGWTAKCRRAGGGRSERNCSRGHDGSEVSSSRPHVPVPQVTCVGAGLPPLAQKLVDRILARQYVDFTELPQAKGKGRMVAQPGEGQLMLLQASNLVHARKTIPDFASWGYALQFKWQCWLVSSQTGW